MFSGAVVLCLFVHLFCCCTSRELPFLRKVRQTPETVLNGLRVESEDDFKGFSTDGVVEVVGGKMIKLRIFGTRISNDTNIKLTTESAGRGEDCGKFGTTHVFQIESWSPELDSGIIGVLLEPNKIAAYHICVHDSLSGAFIHQGNSTFLQVKALPHWIPIWTQIILIIILQLLSGLFSGLNLGLLSLDPTELQIVASVGSPKERKYAKHIIPLRQKGNFLLCSLVIGNALVNSIFTILLDDLTSGLYAVIFSTVGIVLFGEIIPQALCNRFGLAIGSATRWITMVVMGITGVISWPLSLLLNWLLGREIGTVYDRERLVELIRVTKDHNLLENDEVNIISGTLSLKRKTVEEIMTPLEDVFMLPYDALLNFETLAEITREGYTRIPVFEGTRNNIVGLLNIKDMALLDPDDCTAVKTLTKYYSYELRFVFADTKLDVMLDEFKKGSSHMAFIQQITNEDDRDPDYLTIGVITLEDIIEEMIQAEIFDESDKNEIDKKHLRKDLSIFTSRPLYSSLITPQLQHAAFQFLSTSLDAFKSDIVSERILRRLICHIEVARMIRRKSSDTEPSFIYQAGKCVDYFVLILEGRVQVKIGMEGLVFESGPFTHFGVSALTITPDEVGVLGKTPFPALPSPRPSQPRINLERSSTAGVFVPDFTVYAMSDVLFLRIKRSHYIAARRATAMEKQGKLGLGVESDAFGQEMDRCGKEDIGHSDFSPAVSMANSPLSYAKPSNNSMFLTPDNNNSMFLTPDNNVSRPVSKNETSFTIEDKTDP